MTVASIDIGTNTVLLLLARAERDGRIETVLSEQRVPRLGQGVDANRNLSSAAMNRVVEALREYRKLTSPYQPEVEVVCGTSAVRDAGNREEFVRLVKEQTGYDVEVMSGDDEALWAYRGALSGLAGIRKATVVDVGGGSTEITVGGDARVERRISLDVGSVRITERCFRRDPPTHPELENALQLIEDELDKARDFPFAGTTLVGVAGTVTTLAALALGLTTFDPGAVSGYKLSRDVVESLFRTLRELSSTRIRALSGVLEGRSDIITAGTLILREVMAHFKFDEIIVSERGVRYGLVLRTLEK
jgi:exopolyphosphatase/guanosine-5'-triphosphate,3'-diphosphate pyrophosphatase